VLNSFPRFVNPWIVVTALVTGPVFTFRGQNYLPSIWGDDGDLLNHAVNRTPPIGRFHALDPLGLLDPFAGYATFLLRLMIQIVRLGGLDRFTANTFYLLTIIWTLIACWIAHIIGRIAHPLTGFLAAVVIAIMPFSNLVMLAQINPLYMPLVLVLMLTVVTRTYPKTATNQLLVVLFFTSLALTTVTVLLTYVFLAYLIFIQKNNVQNIERRLFRYFSIAIFIQILSYTPRGRILSLSGLLSEFLKCANAFAPQFIRSQILQQKSLWENVLLYGISILLFTVIIFLFFISRSAPNKGMARISLTLFALSFLMIVALIFGNGWLNSHYLFVPTGLFWVGSLLIAQEAISSSHRFRLIPVGILAAIFLSSLSGKYFVI